MFAECTIQYDTKKGEDIYFFVEKQSLVCIGKHSKTDKINISCLILVRLSPYFVLTDRVVAVVWIFNDTRHLHAWRQW